MALVFDRCRRRGYECRGSACRSNWTVHRCLVAVCVPTVVPEEMAHVAAATAAWVCPARKCAWCYVSSDRFCLRGLGCDALGFWTALHPQVWVDGQVFVLY